VTFATDCVERRGERVDAGRDCFDAFFSAWIGLVIDGRRHLEAKQMAQPHTYTRSKHRARVTPATIERGG
jgi:hypothetical protein